MVHVAQAGLGLALIVNSMVSCLNILSVGLKAYVNIWLPCVIFSILFHRGGIHLKIVLLHCFFFPFMGAYMFEFTHLCMCLRKLEVDGLNVSAYFIL